MPARNLGTKIREVNIGLLEERQNSLPGKISETDNTNSGDIEKLGAEIHELIRQAQEAQRYGEYATALSIRQRIKKLTPDVHNTSIINDLERLNRLKRERKLIRTNWPSNYHGINLKDSLDDCPTSTLIHYSRQAQTEGAWKDAAIFQEKLVALYPDNRKALYIYAYILKNIGGRKNLLKAIEVLEKARQLAVNPEDQQKIERLRNQIQQQFDIENDPAAQALFQEYHRLKDQAVELEEQEQFEAAILMRQKMEELEPKPSNRRIIRHLQDKIRSRHEGKTITNLDHWPNDYRTLNFYALDLRTVPISTIIHYSRQAQLQKQWKDALFFQKEVVRRAPRMVKALFYLAQILEKIGSVQTIREEVEVRKRLATFNDLHGIMLQKNNARSQDLRESVIRRRK